MNHVIFYFFQIQLPKQPTAVKKMLDCSYMLNAWKFWVHIKNLTIQRRHQQSQNNNKRK